MNERLQNENPVIYESVFIDPTADWTFGDAADDDEIEYVTASEVFEHIRHVNDPEHPLTLEQLNIVRLDQVTVQDPGGIVQVQFTPTIPHCSMATLIGLCIRAKLLRALPSRFKVTVEISPGSHQSEEAINKQLNDKERVAAALENSHLSDVVNKCIFGS